MELYQARELKLSNEKREDGREKNPKPESDAKLSSRFGQSRKRREEKKTNTLLNLLSTG
jgi:hypothetical protein